MVYVQPPMFDAPSVWQATPVQDLPSWNGAHRVAVDIETCDPQLTTLGPGVRRGGYVVGIAFAIDGGPAHYLPIRHEAGGNLPEEVVWAYLRGQAQDFTGEIVGANLAYDLDYLEEAGVSFRDASFFRDVQIAAPLLNELEMSYSLESIAERTGVAGKDESALRRGAAAWGLDPKGELWKLPARHVGAYATQDVRTSLDILRRQETEIREQDLQAIYDLESRVLPVLVRMRRRGVRIDFDRLERVERWAMEEENKALSEVKVATGIEIRPEDVWKGALIARLIQEMGVTPGRTPTGKPRTDRATVEAINHPGAKLFVRARKFNKIRTTFAASLRRYAVRGRIHCTFNQIKFTGDDGEDFGAAYGRMSAMDPNLQQQPSPDRDPEIASRWRSVFVPDEGGQWSLLDFSSQEPRMTVHYAALARCRGADEMVERFRANPNLDIHAETAALGSILRKQAKIIFLGLAYGMGGAKLCRSLGFPTVRVPSIRLGRDIDVAGPEGEAFLDRFNAMVPFLRQIARMAQNKARDRGYVRTIAGRRCRFPESLKGYEFTHKALNRIVQGSSADQTKQALVDADADGQPLQLQVHDELDLTVADRGQADRVARIMEEAIPLLVPSRVDVAVGPSWGEAE